MWFSKQQNSEAHITVTASQCMPPQRSALRLNPSIFHTTCLTWVHKRAWSLSQGIWGTRCQPIAGHNRRQILTPIHTLRTIFSRTWLFGFFESFFFFYNGSIWFTNWFIRPSFHPSIFFRLPTVGLGSSLSRDAQSSLPLATSSSSSTGIPRCSQAKWEI